MSTRIVAIDGHGGAGKSTLAEELAGELGSAQIVHTDDFASWGFPLDWWPRLLDEVLEPVSGFAESVVVPASTGVVVVDFGGSFTLLSSGAGSADLVSSVVAPRPSSGDVAQADMRASSDRAATGMRAKRRMAGTLAAELCRALGRRSRETLR